MKAPVWLMDAQDAAIACITQAPRADTGQFRHAQYSAVARVQVAGSRRVGCGSLCETPPRSGSGARGAGRRGVLSTSIVVLGDFMRIVRVLGALLVSASATVLATDILSEGVDSGRTGWVKDEKIFTAANVGGMK